MTQPNNKQRNPFIITPMGNCLQGIGDTHFGRVFKNDVRLERRGEYEAMQWAKAQQLLNAKHDQVETVKVQAGDWFDKPTVALSVIKKSIDTLENYAEDPQQVEPLFVISGNHDDAKNTSDVTAWDLLADTMKNSAKNKLGKVRFVKDYEVHTYANGEQILFIGWNITNTACDALLRAIEEGHNAITTVVCHLDKISYGNDENVIPYEFFAHHGIKMVVSGHEHKPYHFFDNGMEIIGTGSLLPYSHAEDDGEEIYVTFHSINEFEEYSLDNNISDKHVRLILDENDQERLDELANVYTLSLKIVKKGVDVEVLDMDNAGVNQVTLQAYDAKSVWESAVAETGLEPVTGQLVWHEIQAKGVEE